MKEHLKFSEDIFPSFRPSPRVEKSQQFSQGLLIETRSTNNIICFMDYEIVSLSGKHNFLRSLFKCCFNG